MAEPSRANDASTRAHAETRASCSAGPDRAKLWPRTASTAVTVRARSSTTIPMPSPSAPGTAEEARCRPANTVDAPGRRRGRVGHDPEVGVGGGHVEAASGGGSRVDLDTASGRTRRDPAEHHRQPLLAGPAGQRPEGEGHRCADDDHRHQDARHGGSRPDGDDGEHQAGGDRPDLATPPAGDHPPTLERREPVADPTSPVSAGTTAHPPPPSGRWSPAMSTGPRWSRPRWSGRRVPVCRGRGPT